MNKLNSYLLGISILLTAACSTNKALVHEGLPLIKSINKQVDYQIGDHWVRGGWSVVPEIPNDTLVVTCFSSRENFTFKTDVDSIAFTIKAGSIKRFYVLVGEDQYAHTVIVGKAFEAPLLSHTTEGENTAWKIKYQDEPSAYIEELRNKYSLSELISGWKSDQEKVLAVLNWTNQQWEHDGNQSPKKNDAISILDEVSEGGRFPCFAYAIVLRDQLTTLGFKARTIYLKTADAATTNRPPGHVATEVYLQDIGKWAFIDGQFNVMPTLKGVPLNAVEFQAAISRQITDFKLETLSKESPTTKREYVDFVFDYLYYFDTTLDNRYDSKERFAIEGKRSLMLVPTGAKALTRINFWDMEVDYCLYTHSLQDFYAKPE